MLATELPGYRPEPVPLNRDPERRTGGCHGCAFDRPYNARGCGSVSCVRDDFPTCPITHEIIWIKD